MGKIEDFLNLRVESGKLDKSTADAVMLKREMKKSNLVGKTVSALKNGEITSVIELLAVKIGVADENGRII